MIIEFIKRLIGKEDIGEKTLKHSSLGDYSKEANRLKGSGHGQEALDYMDKYYTI